MPDELAAVDVQAYARFLADQMALRDWEITVDSTDEDTDNYAMVHCANVRKHAAIVLSPSFWESDDLGQRHTIVHELLHCHAVQIFTQADTIKGLLGTSAWLIYSQGLDNLIELMVDALADGWSNSLPTMPEWQEMMKEQP